VDLITAAIPFFFLLMGVEALVGRARGRRVFRAPDVMTDLALGVLQVLFTVVAAGLLAGPYLLVYEHRLWTAPSSPWTWLVAFVGVDFLYYWFHRVCHRSMLAWATHAPHHSSEDYNLAVALRQGPVQPLCSQLFYLPLALVGVPFEVFATLGAINTLYQFWIHTELIGKLGPLERVFNTPSHHRVHHGCSERSLDKNHGGIFIVWDRLFGTFREEQEPQVYGTVKPAATWNPLVAWWLPFGEIVAKMRHCDGIVDVVRALFAPPEWLPPGMARAPAVAGPRAKFDERPASGVVRYAIAQFVVALGLSVAFLLLSPKLDGATRWLAAAWLTASYGSLGGLLDGRAWARGLEVVRHLLLVPLLIVIVGALG
jgi:sterol desaturase/sphingolipid hydroxylase (fatty acid hydroxylase superfamily)